MLIIPRGVSLSPPPPLAAKILSPVTPEPCERPLDELSREELLELALAQKVYLFFPSQGSPSKYITNSMWQEQLSIKKKVETSVKRNVQTLFKNEG